jgi:phosphate transport system permease protein
VLKQGRKLFDRSFTGLSVFSVVVVALALLVLLAPITVRGLRAFVFRATIEHRRVMLDEFGHGDPSEVEAEIAQTREARLRAYDLLKAFEDELQSMRFVERRKYAAPLGELKDRLRELLGPLPGERAPILVRKRYGQTRWDRAQVKLEQLLYIEQYDYSDVTQMGRRVLVPRANDFEGTRLEPLFAYVEANVEPMLNPRWTVHWRFLTDESIDAHFFGGIWPEVLGTLYLTLGAILFAVPMGIISAIYLIEYAPEGWLVGVLRTCVSTLAGVPSIVFGLFGLAFFINTIHVSESKSVLAGSLTLAVLILPVVIRASEEAIRAVPQTYKEAALSLGSSKWRTIVRVVLPAALPGVLTGVVISMGRAAGETAPIIFTAAVSVGRPLQLWQTVNQPTPALPWNVYNLCTEHEAVDEIRHVQYGMVLTLVALVLFLNCAAIIMRARISRKLAG